MTPGLSHLDGTIVKPTWINITNDENGNNMRATVIIPNRSPVAFEMVCPDELASAFPTSC